MTRRRATRSKRDLTLREVDAVLNRARLAPGVGELPARVSDLAKRRRSARRPLTPLLTGGENGGAPEIAARLVIEDGQVLEIPARRGWGGSAAIVDWLNFTCHEDEYVLDTGNGAKVTDDEVLREVSYVLESIFGFGITSSRPSGANFYDRSYVLGDDWGMVCHGSQAGTVLVMVNGSGLAAAADGWEGRAVDWFERSKARITRCDLAHDDFEGRHSVDHADVMDLHGFFASGKGRPPVVEHCGAWRRPDGRGRTLYVGRRSSGKFLRVYEKGKQLGDRNSNWVRWEVEFKSSDRELPYDILLKPGEYLSAAYPALAWISAEQDRIKTIRRQVESVYEKVTQWIYQQVGPSLSLMLAVEGSADAVLAKVVRESRIPRALHVPDLKLAPRAIHHDPVFALPPETAMSMAFN